MFGLGVFVGRNSSPVLFETRPFQEHLGRMISDVTTKTPEKEKVNLIFYDVLDEPVYHPVKGKQEDPGEITPGPETGQTASVKPVTAASRDEDIPVKRSRKLATWHKAPQKSGSDASSQAPPAKKSAPYLATKVLQSKTRINEKTDAKSQQNKPDAGKTSVAANDSYTIQVASYKNLNDALAQMVILNEKGISSYRVSVKINGSTWYRVRTGSFTDFETAKGRLAQLAGSGVNGMVIKKE